MTISSLDSELRITPQQYDLELDEAEAEYEAGDYISTDKMLRLIQQWQR
jgi:hypothetical protein